MGMLHCTDCEFAQFEQNAETGRWRGSCKRGYTLANPDPDATGPDHFFVEDRDLLVPVIDPRGREYLRTKDICDGYIHLSEVDRAKDGRGGIWRFLTTRKQRRGQE